MSTIKENVALELHKQARRNYQRRRVTVKGILDLMEIDLVEMLPFAKLNKGYRYILTAIDAFTKKGYAVPVKRKTGHDVTEAFSNILKTSGTPKHVHSDRGKEWYNHDFKKLMKRHNINHYSTFSPLKATIVERFNRSLKDLMYKQFSIQGSYKWINILPDLLSVYNNRKHRTINMRPNDVTKTHESRLLTTIYSVNGKRRISRFNVGDIVRVSKHKGVFSKGYHPNWSTELFKIRSVLPSLPTTYLLQDVVNNENILGTFYAEELQKTKFPDVYLVEKVLKKKGSKAYVKWLGFDKPSWIDIKDII